MVNLFNMQQKTGNDLIFAMRRTDNRKTGERWYMYQKHNRLQKPSLGNNESKQELKHTGKSEAGLLMRWTGGLSRSCDRKADIYVIWLPFSVAYPFKTARTSLRVYLPLMSPLLGLFPCFDPVCVSFSIRLTSVQPLLLMEFVSDKSRKTN